RQLKDGNMGRDAAYAGPRVPSRDWVGTLTVEILKGTSPELAIKIAYDFGRGLRMKGGEEEDLPRLLETWVAAPFKDSPLLPYIRAGFVAGHGFKSLPWRRQIEQEGAIGTAPERDDIH